METRQIVLEHAFDEETLIHLAELRAVRLEVAKKMLADVEETAHSLKAGGYLEQAADLSTRELREELEYRVAMMEERMKNPHTLYEDELSLYVDLLREPGT